MDAAIQPAIVYIITKLELGGAQKICLTLFKDLHTDPGSCFLISGDEGVLVDEVKNLPNVFLLKTFKREIAFFSLWCEVRTFFSIIAILRRLKRDNRLLIVHTHGSKAGVLGRLAALCAGVKTRIHTVHGFSFHAHQNAVIWVMCYLTEWLCAFFTTHFVCVSCADVVTGKKLLPGFKKKHSLIRAAVDVHHFFLPAIQCKPFPDEDDCFIFGTISCFKPQKNIFDLLQAFHRVYQENRRVRLEIIGDGVLRRALETWVSKHSLNDVIILHGWKYDTRPFLRTWHCFVLTSLWEGMPCALVEARLSRLPVICYDTGGVRDVVHHGVNGFVIYQQDWERFAETMLFLSCDNVVHMAFQRYPDNLSDFDISSMVERHRKLYKQLITHAC